MVLAGVHFGLITLILDLEHELNHRTGHSPNEFKLPKGGAGGDP